MDTGTLELAAAIRRADAKLEMVVLAHEQREETEETFGIPGFPDSEMSSPARAMHVWRIRVKGFGRNPDEQEIEIEAGPNASYDEIRQHAIKASAEDWLAWKAGD